MWKSVSEANVIKRLRKRPWYHRFRRRLPGWEDHCGDDRELLNQADIVKINWPDHLKKPRVGVVPDNDPYPRWTKFCRFLDNNGFDYELYNIHAHDWLRQAREFDVVMGLWSCELHCLQEMREKYWVLENYLGKRTYPSSAHALLYEDKKLEAYIATAHGVRFARTYISHDKEDALRLIQELAYPVVSKIVPSSGSVGVELVPGPKEARRIVSQAFSFRGRKTHRLYERQKNYVYFQEFIPNDGYDIRAIVVRNLVFGYFRKVLPGDFRASGMNLIEKRALPKAPMVLALELNRVVRSPMLVVDMLHGLDGNHYVTEYSPMCQIKTPAPSEVDEISGAFIFDDEGNYRFEQCRYWLHELALREFFLTDYIPRACRIVSEDLETPVGCQAA